MILILTGLPGVGKGTQAQKIIQEYDINYLSTGDIFRNLMKSSGDLTDELNSYIKNGKLVPDELTIKVLDNEMSNKDLSKGFLFDGFPRTVNQAKYLDELLENKNLKVDYVINLHLDEEVIKDRLVNRLTCPNCQTSYHKTNLPPKVEGICDKCGTKLVQREDDQLEKIENRIEVAKEQTVPILDYYNNVKTVNVNKKSTDEVFLEIKSIVK